MSDVIDKHNFMGSKPEKKRRHGDPLFAECINTRIPIVQQAVLRTLDAIKVDDKQAALDAENSFKTPEQQAEQNARQLARPALSVIPGFTPMMEQPPQLDVDEARRGVVEAVTPDPQTQADSELNERFRAMGWTPDEEQSYAA